MDRSVEPCQNFYRYACGGWLDRHVIPETSSRYSVFDILRDKLETILKGVLEEESEQDREAFRKAKILYASCMNESLIEERGAQPLLDLIDYIGGWPVASDDWNTTADREWSLEDTLAKFTSHFHKRVLLDLFVWADDLDSNQHVLYIDQPEQGLPTRDYYFSEEREYKTVREAYLQFMMSVMQMTREARNLTSAAARVREDAVQVMQLETDIANVIDKYSHIQIAELCKEEFHLFLFPKMTRKSAVYFALQGFNWTRFVLGVLSEVFINVQPDEEVVVYCTPYLQKLGGVLARYNNRTLRNYLTWHLVTDRVGSLSSRFKDAREQYKKALYRNTLVEARWRDCVRYVQNTMENAVGALYVKQTFAGESKRMAMAIKDQIGYPDFILEEGNDRLDLECAHLNFSKNTYFENMLKNLHAAARKSLKKLREPVDTDFWMTGAAVVNAFYSPNRNQIATLSQSVYLSLCSTVFPAGILQPPFYSKEQLQALNFGGIGMVIGHEITHGFDDSGRNFDKDGNMLNWWSNFSAEHFRAQSQCMVQQYGNFTWDLAGGQNVCGISTLGENIADNGGVRQAYKAYKKWREEEGEEPYLPGLDLNNEQLFFLNFAQVWCGTYRPEYASQSIRTDSHSPLDYRVLGSLQNFDAFSEAFHCKPGSPMNPSVKCRVW
ncbi:hypothetical protein NFI96_033429 [Prochilodus magdalenae]|nr:hypothetical protein NFI96_033429 [Prochilodus magdalenae]